jgi:ATP-dependent protease Clp ATPase subunit
MNRIPSVPNLQQVVRPQPHATYNELRQKNDQLEAEVGRLKELVDYQHAIIVGQQPLMSHLQWEASKWNHYKRILEAKEGKAAVSEAESQVQQRMSGLI